MKYKIMRRLWPALLCPALLTACAGGSGETPETGAPAGADFAVRIAGDSMEPEIEDGQVVWVKRRETLESGRVGIFVLGGMAYCKRLHADENGACLMSANPAYAPIELTPETEYRVCGEVVG